jgi:C-terminal processing protease CtpA/Prc
MRYATIVGLLFRATILSATADEKIPLKLLQEDFQIMRHALEEGHPGIYWYSSKADMDRTFDRAYRKINHPMTDLEFWRLAAPVVGQIKCGHTYLWFPKTLDTQANTTIPYLPFVTTILGGRMFVYRDLVNPGSSLEGSEILSVNGVSMKELLNEVRTFLTGDGNGKTAKDWRIANAGGDGIYLYAIGIRSPFHLTYRTRDGRPHTVELEGQTAPMNLKKLAAREPQPDSNADLKFLDDGTITVLTIRHWSYYVDRAGKESFPEFLERSFAQIQTNGTRSLIIDVRDDTGGADPPGKQLFAYLWDRPFYYDKDIVSNAREFDFFKYDPAAKPIPAKDVELRADGKYHHIWHPNMGLQQPLQPHFGGKVFVLMNGGSFSTSTEFLSVLHSHKRATFVGEETGGGYYSLNAGIYAANLELPNSKLKLHFGLMSYYQAVSDDYKYRDRGVLPDYPITHTIGDLMAGRDKDMELALSLARSQVAAPRRE